MEMNGKPNCKGYVDSYSPLRALQTILQKNIIGLTQFDTRCSNYYRIKYYAIL